MFNGEYDLLELRLDILSPFVDKFVIVECATTFSGKSKPLYYELEKYRYEKWHDKIIYYVNDENYSKEELALAENYPALPKDAPWWKREFLQKEALKKAFIANDDDRCFFSDCDEIWNPLILDLDLPIHSLYKLHQLVYMYYLNLRSEEEWAGTILTSYKFIQNKCLNKLKSSSPCFFLQHGGWHFTHQGGLTMLKRKINDYGHQELNVDKFKDTLEDKITNQKDFLGRNLKLWLETSKWPSFLFTEEAGKYAHLCKYI